MMGGMVTLQDVNGNYVLVDPDEIFNEVIKGRMINLYGMTLDEILILRNYYISNNLTFPVRQSELDKIS